MTQEVWTIRRVLEWTIAFFERKDLDAARLSAELLLAHVVELPRIQLYMNYDRELEPGHLEAYRNLVKRASEHEPIAYLTGSASFFGMEFSVDGSVLIPRPETENLVEAVLQQVRGDASLSAPRILDVCCGSGCISAALASQLPTATLYACDISTEAVAMAQRNIERLELVDRISVLQGDLFAALSASPDKHPFQIVVSNPPYIATAELAEVDRNVRDYEPHLALDGGDDGLAVIRRLISDAPDWMTAGGWLFIEIAYNQKDAVLEMAHGSEKLTSTRVLKDDAGHDRILVARRT